MPIVLRLITRCGGGDQIVPIADSANAKVANPELPAFTRVQSARAA
jgi:hypothetical protein